MNIFNESVSKLRARRDNEEVIYRRLGFNSQRVPWMWVSFSGKLPEVRPGFFCAVPASR